MLLTVLFEPNVAIAITVCVAVLVGFIGGNSLELTVFTAVGGVLAALAIRKSARTSTFFRVGLLVGISNTSVILIYRLGNTDVLGILQLIGVSLLNGLFSASLTLGRFFHRRQRFQRSHRAPASGTCPAGPSFAPGVVAPGTRHVPSQPDGVQPGRAGRSPHWRRR